MDTPFIFSLLIILMSVVIHEVSHGFAALALGDRTAEYAGRLTLNPIKHIDPIGTILFPFISLMIFPGSILFGWAKPVPYNPYNLKNQRWGEAMVAFAGPLSNILIALIFGLLIRFYIVPEGLMATPFGFISQTIVLTNIVLALFNLVPIPPLDGSKILSAFLPSAFMKVRESLERFGFVGVLLFVIVLWQFFVPFIFALFKLFTGL